jgi:pimeloyl-ACP methyl ester carboxylesterase
VLVANGVEDIMIPTIQSYALAQALPNAKLIIYPDSGHGFLFQHAKEFARDVLEFLETE